MDHTLPHLLHQEQEPNAPSGPDSLPQSITAPPRVLLSSRYPENPPSEGSEQESLKEEPFSPFDEKDNPYDAASSAMHGPGNRPSRRRTTDTHVPLLFNVPHDTSVRKTSSAMSQKDHSKPATLGVKLDKIHKTAEGERRKYARKAKINGYALNIAIGLQVVLGALTTGLAAATTGRHTSIMVSILGAFSTIVASFLARARGTGEPERSKMRAKDLDQFLRELDSFRMDRGHATGNEYEKDLFRFRERLEELLGNTPQQSVSAEKNENSSRRPTTAPPV